MLASIPRHQMVLQFRENNFPEYLPSKKVLICFEIAALNNNYLCEGLSEG